MEKIAVIGLGYVGLPLSVALARKFDTLGFDISKRRVDELRQGKDSTHEVTAEVLNDSSLQLSSDAAELEGRTIYIVTVPTPIDDANRPDFKAILSACSLVGPALSPGCVCAVSIIVGWQSGGHGRRNTTYAWPEMRATAQRFTSDRRCANEHRDPRPSFSPSPGQTG